ncbi:zinc-binding dehydrogenase [Nonomuraea ferruginea]
MVAVDISGDALHLAELAGATHFADGSAGDSATQVRELTRGGAHVSIDALGSPRTCAASVESLRRRGRHVQVGLLPGAATPVPMGRVIAQELRLLGSHGMAAHAYPRMLELIRAGVLHPDQLVTRTIGLADAGEGARLDRLGGGRHHDHAPRPVLNRAFPAYMAGYVAPQ